MSGSQSASSEHRSALPEGTRLHNYTLQRVLGAGGFGITYMAREEVTERAVAIKEYLPSSLAVRERDGMTVHPVSESTRNDYEWGLARFRQEAKLLLSMRHHNIVPSLNYFEANGTAYLVMEYQDGQTLAQLTAGGVALEESEVRDFVGPLLDGVEAVHKSGLLHRDIKPDNIFIRRDGTPVLIDFGSARQSLGHHSHSLTAVVTDGYAPFEQYERQGDQGPWTDIYAIGAVLFRCVVGHRPPTATKRLSNFYRGAPDPAALGFDTIRQRCSAPFAAAVEAALAVNGEDRPQTVADLRALLADTGARATVRRPAAANPTLLAGGLGTRAASRAETLGTPAASMRPQASQAEPAPRRRLLPLYAGAAVLLLAGTAGAAYFGVGGIDIPGFTATSSEAREAEEAKRKAAEEAARRKAEEEAAAQRRAEEEAARRKADEEAARRRAEEEAARRKAEEDAARRKAEQEAAARKAEEERRKADADRRRREDAEKQRADAEEKARREEAARRRAEEEERRKEQDEAKRKAEAEAKRKAEEARRKAEEERAKAGYAARPSWYAADRNRGALYFAQGSAQIEASAAAALARAVADARAGGGYRMNLVASSALSEGNPAEAARLRAQRLDAVRVWLVARGIDSDRIRSVEGGARGDGAEQRYVAISVEVQQARPDGPGRDRPGTDRPGTDRPGTDRPGTDRPGTSDTGQRYERAELARMMFRLIKGAAYSGNIVSETEGALSGGDGPSALAVCVNWAATTPQRAVIGGAYSWTARSGSLVAERALRGCQRLGRSGCQCTIVEAGSANALVLPQSFLQRYAR